MNHGPAQAFLHMQLQYNSSRRCATVGAALYAAQTGQMEKKGGGEGKSMEEAPEEVRLAFPLSMNSKPLSWCLGGLRSDP